MIPRAIFYPSLLYNVMMERFAGRHWFDRIDDTVVLGALPLRSVTDEVARFKELHCIFNVFVICNMFFLKHICDAPCTVQNCNVCGC